MSKIEQQRQAAWRTKLIRHASEKTKNVSKTCRHFGVSRKTFYKWVARHKSFGEADVMHRRSSSGESRD
jgi:transposase-like protein